MVENSSAQNFNKRNDNGTKKNILIFNNSLNHIISIIDIIITLLKTQIFRRKEQKYNIYRKVKSFYSFEIKNEYTMIKTIKKINKIKIIDNKVKKNNIKKGKNILINFDAIIRKYLIMILIQSIIMNIFSQNCLLDLLYFQDSIIKLKLKGIGESYLFGNTTNYSFPYIDKLKEIYINGVLQDEIDYKYYFNETDNIVNLIWDDDLNDCKFMFLNCSNITEIDLSNFNNSQVTNISYMFSYCLSLTSLNLSNVDTSQVKDMRYMFRNCSSLTS